MDAGSSGSVPTKEGWRPKGSFPNQSLPFAFSLAHSPLKLRHQAKQPLLPKHRRGPKPHYGQLKIKPQKRFRRKLWRHRRGSRKMPEGEEEKGLQTDARRKRRRLPPGVLILQPQKKRGLPMQRKRRRAHCLKSKQSLPRPKSISEKSRERRKRAERSYRGEWLPALPSISARGSEKRRRRLMISLFHSLCPSD